VLATQGETSKFGQCFTNFTNAVEALRFWKALNKYKWNVGSNRKTCEVFFTIIQRKGKSLPHVGQSAQTKIYHNQ